MKSIIQSLTHLFHFFGSILSACFSRVANWARSNRPNTKHDTTPIILTSDSGMETLTLALLLNRYSALLRDVSRWEAEAITLRVSQIEPYVTWLRAKLGLPFSPANQPEFWLQLENDRGLAVLALTLQVLLRLGISCSLFETVGKRLNTNDPDAIFWEIIRARSDDEFRNN